MPAAYSGFCASENANSSGPEKPASSRTRSRALGNARRQRGSRRFNRGRAAFAGDAAGAQDMAEQVLPQLGVEGEQTSQRQITRVVETVEKRQLLSAVGRSVRQVQIAG